MSSCLAWLCFVALCVVILHGMREGCRSGKRCTNTPSLTKKKFLPKVEHLEVKEPLPESNRCARRSFSQGFEERNPFSLSFLALGLDQPLQRRRHRRSVEARQTAPVTWLHVEICLEGPDIAKPNWPCGLPCARKPSGAPGASFDASDLRLELL